jgi:hypothetical protein
MGKEGVLQFSGLKQHEAFALGANDTWFWHIRVSDASTETNSPFPSVLLLSRVSWDPLFPNKDTVESFLSELLGT